MSSGFIPRNYRPRKPPTWVPQHLAFNCKSCDIEFNNIWNKIHHCRNCGCAFCKDCCNNFMTIQEFGYFEPTRVCAECKDALEMQKML